MLSTDTTVLTNLISTCFTLSANLDLTPDQRQGFLVVGKQLRGTLVNLLSAKFKDGTQAVMDANQQLNQINQQAAQLTKDLSNLDNVLNQINGLVGVLDGLLKIAVAFV